MIYRFLLALSILTFTGLNIKAAEEEKKPDLEGKVEVNVKVSDEEKAKVKAYFKKFIKSLGENPKDYNLEIVESEQLNAYATFGNKVVVNTALMNYIESDSGLAFVIAHELGHIEAKHVHKGLIRDGIGGLFKFFFFKKSTIYDGVNQFHHLYYSRSKEREADYFAVKLINEYYCDVPGKLEFFQKIAKEEGRSGSKISEYFSTHPLPSSRNEYLKAEIMGKNCKI